MTVIMSNSASEAEQLAFTLGEKVRLCTNLREVRKVVDQGDSDLIGFEDEADMNIESRFPFNYSFEFDGVVFIVEMEEDFYQDDEENE